MSRDLEARFSHGRRASWRLGALATALVALSACSAYVGDRLGPYEAALARTDPAKKPTLPDDSPEAKVAMDRVLGLYADFTPANLKAHVREVYAEDAFFRDPIKEVHGIDEIEKYFVDASEQAAECTFDIQDVVVQDGEHYLRWIMTVRAKRWADEPPSRQVGMSHIRFDTDGKISFHEDYLDTAAYLWERIPIMGGIIRYVRGSL